MTLPLVISPNDLGHISAHEQIHAFLDPVVSPFTLSQDAQGTLGARPAAGLRGRYYLATDEMVLYRDSGTAWQPIHDMLETWNASLLQSSANLLGFRSPTVTAHKIVAQTVNSGPWTTITFTSELADNDDMHSISTNTERLTAVRAGLYIIGAEIGFEANPTGVRRLAILRNDGLTVSAVNYNAPLNGVAQIQTNALVPLAVGEYVYAQGIQESGIAISCLGGRFWAALQSTL